MEQTFMTIHNLSPDANILFASESIVDILGYQPHEVQGKSCFDYFHPDEVPFARSIHSRGVLLDKAAVLHYARILSRDGQWVSCECCFTIVHDVFVASISIYRRGEKSERRAIEAPQIRRIFSSSPRDPRYHMLEHLSPKFKMQPMEREPRAALILNRFTRTLTVMFATNAVATILGVRPDQIQDKSFYECIAENCLADAIKCLESAKANDSIAYLRFWYRDPRREEDFEDEEDDEEEDEDEDAEEEEEDEDEDEDEQDEEMTSSNGTDSDTTGSVESPGTAMDVDLDGASLPPKIKTEPTISPEPAKATRMNHRADSKAAILNAFSPLPEHQAYQTTPGARQQASSPTSGSRRRRREPIPTFELEAVVSCTSDGLVVILRKARPPIPSLHPPLLPVDFENGLFAAPWSEQPIRPYYPPELFYTFRPPLLPQYMPLREHVKAGGGPPTDQLMKSIRDVAVFAWALVGINGNVATYGRGVPRETAQPHDGLPIWDPDAPKSSYLGPEPPRGPTRRRGSHSVEGRPTNTTAPSSLPYAPGFSAEAPQGYSPTSGGFNSMNPSYPNSHAWSSTPSFESWPSVPQVQPPSQSPSSSGFHHHPPPPEPWVEASAAYPPRNANHYAIPTTQAHAFGRDTTQGYRNNTW
ncbi:hypothetical protein F5B20DRAFT_177944 [Whalleya microplaca]|nr:hypothetical protein F5B20DRAFT_177944 [Whalleya microplaca]